MRQWLLVRSYLFNLLGQGTFGILSEPAPVDGRRRLDRSFVIVEDPWNQNKTNVSCIPEGIYKVRWGTFPKRGPCLYVCDRHDPPGDIDVEGRLAIQFHVGNTIADTQGCLLPNLRFEIVANTPRGVESGKAVELLEAAVERGEEIELVITHYHPN